MQKSRLEAFSDGVFAIIIGVYWVTHHNSMHAMRKTDRNFLWLNILLLLCVSFIPFPTSLLGRYPFQAGPIQIYGFTLIACNAIGYLMLVYVWYHPHLAAPHFTRKYMRRHTPVYIVVNGLYLCAILAAHSLPLLSY